MKKNEIEPKSIKPPEFAFMDGGKNAARFDISPFPLAKRCHMPAEGGMYLYFDEFKYPHKGVPFEGATRANDAVKRSALSMLRFFSSKPMRYFILLFFFIPGRKKIAKAFFHQYALWIDHVMRDFYLQPRFCCDVVRELHRVLSSMNLSDDEKILATAVCMFLEYDDAYRYRVQDIFENIHKATFIENPVSEIRRLASIGYNRDDPTMKEKFWSKVPMFIGMMLHEKYFKNMLIELMEKVDMEKMFLDDGDWYHCLAWNGYNFRGMSFEERFSLRKKIDTQWKRTKKGKSKELK